MELYNLYGDPEFAGIQAALMADLRVGVLRVQVTLPHRRRCKFIFDSCNDRSPYREPAQR